MKFNDIPVDLICDLSTPIVHLWAWVSYKECVYATIGNEDLGFSLDRKLTFHDHITVLAKGSFWRLGFLLRN